eukprot:1562548-Rhodomonas_salina.3
MPVGCISKYGADAPLPRSDSRAVCAVCASSHAGSARMYAALSVIHVIRAAIVGCSADIIAGDLPQRRTVEFQLAGRTPGEKC